MTDCLIVGYNNRSFEDYIESIQRMGTDQVAYKVLRSSFIEHQGKPYGCMDILNRFHFEGRENDRPFHSFDFMQPVITYLSTYLDRHGFSYDYVNLFHKEREKLIDKLRSGDLLSVAITTTFYETAEPILEVMELVREHNPTVPIIVGGPHVAYQMKLMDEAAAQVFFRHIGADYYIINSEGESALAGLLAVLKGDADNLAEVPNLAYRDGDGYKVSLPMVESNPLEENQVDYRLFPPDELGELVSLRTAKSCPFRCSFCDFPGMAGKYRYTGVEVVERELDELAELGATTLTFIDDTFNVPKKRFKELLRMMIRKGYDFKWNCFYRADHGDEECIDLMAEAGCEGVFMGIESGSDAMLKVMNKTARREHYQQAIPHLNRVGIVTYASLIVGFPGETVETVDESISLLQELQPDFFQANIWYCHPATPIFKQKEELGIRGSAYNWSHNTMDSATAADLVERLVLTVDRSTWLPYYLWNVFYLQRRGMTLATMKEFIEYYNSLVKEKILDPRRTADDAPEVVEALRRRCQYDREHPPEEPVAWLSGADYRHAEERWLARFEGAPAAPEAPQLLPGEQAEGLDGELAAASVSAAVVDALATAYDLPTPATVVAAALAVALSAEREGDEVAVVASMEAASGDSSVPPSPLPLRLAVADGMTFGELVAAVAAEVVDATSHGRYGLHLLTNGVRLSILGQRQPALPALLRWNVEPGGTAAPSGDGFLDGVLDAWPELAHGLDCYLEVSAAGDRLALTGRHRPSASGDGADDRLARRVAALLVLTADRPGAPLSELASAAAAVAGGPPAAPAEVVQRAPRPGAGASAEADRV